MRNSTNLSLLPINGKHVFSKVRLLGLMLPILLFSVLPRTINAQPSCSASIDTVASYYGANVSCFGAEDGALRADLVTSVPNQLITYNWEDQDSNPIGTGKFLYDLGAGTYYVTATDFNGCSATASYTLVDPLELEVSITGDNILCFGETGSVAADVTGGTQDPNIPTTGGYYYTWSLDGSGTSVTIDEITPADAGLYAVTVADANGCVANATFNLVEPPAISVDLPNYQTNVSCYGLSDGAMMISGISGGTTPYSISWSQGGNQIASDTYSVSGLSAGTYDLLVTDAEGCEVSESIVITQPEEINVSIAETNVSCFGLDNGSLELTITPSSNYAITWSNGETTSTINNLAPGDYSVQVVDLNSNCAAGGAAFFPASSLPANWNFSTSGTYHTIIGNPEDIFLDGVNGSNNIQVGDYIGVFYYDGAALECGGYTLINSNTADFNIAAWADDNLVTGKDGFENGDLFLFRVFRPGVNEFKTVTQLNFNPTLDGELYVGGQSLIESLVFDENTPSNLFNQVVSSWAFSNTGTFQTILVDNQDVYLEGLTGGSNLTVGDYIGAFYLDNGDYVCAGYVEVTTTTSSIPAFADDNTTPEKDGFTTGDDIYYFVYRPSTLQLFTDITSVSFESGVGLTTGATFSGGQSRVDQLVYSNTPPAPNYGSGWDYINTGTFHTIIIENSGILLNAPYGTQSILPGDYIGVFFDDNGVLKPAGYAEVGTNAQTVIAAWGDDNTTTAVKDGFEVGDPFVFKVYRPLMNFFTEVYSVTYQTGTNLNEGLFVSNGQSIISNLEFSVNAPIASLSATITEPDLLETTYTKTDILCNGDGNGAIDISVVGGTVPYTYAWSNSQTTEDISGLNGGFYTVTVTDANNCENVVTIEIIEPDALAISEAITNVTCNAGTDGEIDITVTGGVTPYTYAWSNNATSEDLTGLTAGDYSVTITDDNACEITSVLFEVTEPAAIDDNEVLSTFVGGFNISCNGATDGEIELVPTGGTGAYTYEWSDNVSATSASRTNLAAGTYNVTITDAALCTAEFTYTLTEPEPMVVQFSVDENVSCNGLTDGAVTYDIDNAYGTLSFEWNNGTTTGTTLDNLAAGTYNFTVTDENNCSHAAGDLGILPWTFTSNTGSSHAILIPSAASLTFDGGSIEAGDYIGVFFYDNGTEKCAGYVQWTGANASLIAWGDDTNTAGIKEGFDSNEEFTYKVYRPTVGEYAADATYSADSQFTDEDEYASNGYSGLEALNAAFDITLVNITTVTITQPEVLTASITGDLIVCNGGTADLGVDVNGGTAPYTYSWTGGGTDATLLGAIAGTYVVTVTDANNCTVEANSTFTEPAAISFDVTVIDPLCNGEATGAASVTSVSGGYTATNYTLDWGTANPLALAAGNYTVTLTDDEGCEATEDYLVEEPSLLTIDPTVTPTTCISDADGAISILVTGGTQPVVSYAWSNGGTTNEITGLTAGDYTVTVEDSNGCTLVETIEATEPTAIVVTETLSTYDGGFNLTCFESADGAIALDVTGGAGNYTYLWSNAETTEDINNLDAGPYTVTITDGNGCEVIESFTLTQPGQITVTVDATTSYLTGGIPYNTTCNGFDGGAEITDITNEIGTNLTYAWTGGTTLDAISDVPSGVYNVTVTDENSCTGVGTVTLTGPGPVNFTADVLSDFNGFEVSCFNGENGQIEFDWDNGVGPFDIYFSDWNVNAAIAINANNTTVDGFSAGTYYAILVDNNGCATISDEFTLTSPTEITLPDPHVFAPSCADGSDGSIDLTGISGGIPPYDVQWVYTTYPAQTGFVLTGLDAESTYIGIVSDDNGCSVIHEFTIPNVAPIVINSVTPTDIDCYGAATGEITADVEGGSGTFEFSVDGTNYSSNAVTGLTAGDYTLYIRDTYGCVVEYGSLVTIDQQTEITASSTIEDASCNGAADGEIAVVVSGGDGTYTYNWVGLNNTTASVNGLEAGSYELEVTDGLACTVSFTFMVDEPAVLDATASITDVSCNGGADGAATVSITGGTTPYVGEWSNGETSQSITNVVAGTYTYTVTDVNNCEITGSVTITEPDAIDITETITHVTCFDGADGQIELTIDGGTAPYSNFVWSDGTNTVGTSMNLTNVEAGTYTVEFTDVNSCSYTAQYSITEPAQIEITGTATDISCNNADDGAITISNVTGGSGTYTFSWTEHSDASFTSTDMNQIGLSEGQYTLVVEDGNGCTASASFEIINPDVITISLEDNTPANCTAPDGSLEISAVGGTGAYTYAWSNGGTDALAEGLLADDYTVTVTDANLCVANMTYTVSSVNNLVANTIVTDVACFGEATGIIEVDIQTGNAPFTFTYNGLAGSDNEANLLAGTYDVVVTDNYGCQAIIDDVEVEQPAAALTATVDVTDETCFGLNNGIAEITANGGTSPYTYSWDGLSYVSDVELIEITPGTYDVLVEDANGCDLTVSYTVDAATQITLDFAVTNAGCDNSSDGAVTVTPSGGNDTQYFYDWSTGPQTASLTGLADGTYTVTVYDANQCSAAESIDVEFDFGFYFDNASVEDVTCFEGTDGSITVNYQTTTPNGEHYTFVWKNLDDDVLRTDENVYVSTLNNLGAGTYVLEIRSEPFTGCFEERTFVVSQPDPIVVTPNLNLPSCYKFDDGSITLDITGGSGDFTYLWSKGANYVTHNVLDGSIDNINAGIYKLTVTDANSAGCSDVQIVILTQPDPISSTIVATDITCFGDNDGSVLLSVTGGTGTYTYAWDGLAINSNELTALAAGLYEVTITDQNNCTATNDATVLEPAVLAVANLDVTDALCNGDNGTIIPTVTGGNFPYSFTWSTNTNYNPVISTNDFVNGVADDYFLKVIDNKGCEVEVTATIDEPAPLVVSISQTVFDATNSNALASATGGSSPYSYAWSNGINSALSAFLAAGDTYTVTVTDANSCSAQESILIQAVSPIMVDGPDMNVDNQMLQTNLTDNGLLAKVYPNPSKDGLFNLMFNTSELDRANIEIYDALGKLVQSEMLTTTQGGIHTIELPASKGIYYLRIITNEFGSVTKQLIISE